MPPAYLYQREKCSFRFITLMIPQFGNPANGVCNVDLFIIHAARTQKRWNKLPPARKFDDSIIL